jgi:inorganic pyrophosphatase
MSGVTDLYDVPRHLTAEIGHFFNIYKQLEPDKSTQVRGWRDRGVTEDAIRQAQARVR